jgi:hypothetical protein
MGEADGGDSLMRVFEEQIRESLRSLTPELEEQIPLTSAELAAYWYQHEASAHEKAGVAHYFQSQHQRTPEDFLAKQGPRKFGREVVASGLPAGKLKGKFKERFAHLYDQITQKGSYNGLLFMVDEFKSWQDRHVPGTAAYAEDGEILETLAFVLPAENRNIPTPIASQGDLPQTAHRSRSHPDGLADAVGPAATGRNKARHPGRLDPERGTAQRAQPRALP